MTTKVKLIQTVRIKQEEAERLKEKAWQISMKAEEFIKEPDLIHFLIEEFLDEVEYRDGGLRRKKNPGNPG